MHKGLLYFILLTILFITGCDSSNQSDKDPLPTDTWFTLKVNDTSIQAQLALMLSEKQKGLMHRQELGENSGMLFPYESPQQVAFWMKNTPLPLDLGLFDGDGVLKEIHRLMPYDMTSVRSHSSDIQFALEMHQGWYAAHGLFPGSKLDLQLVINAVKERGFEPGEFGLASR